MIDLRAKKALIPRDQNGNPKFTRLVHTGSEDPPTELPPSVLQVFNPDEVLELVNRALYQLEYQQFSHAKRRLQQSELEKPIKAKFREMFPTVSWIKASDEQLAAVLQKLKDEAEPPKK